jgi:hypothetical protein
MSVRASIAYDISSEDEENDDMRRNVQKQIDCLSNVVDSAPPADSQDSAINKSNLAEIRKYNLIDNLSILQESGLDPNVQTLNTNQIVPPAKAVKRTAAQLGVAPRTQPERTSKKQKPVYDSNIDD